MYLEYIEDKDLIRSVRRVLGAIEGAKNKDIFKNGLDPFGAFFDSISGGIGFDEWLQAEQARQAQKSLQNAIGEFHQDILGDIKGCLSNPPGEGADILNKSMGWCAELKNKFNTTKGNHKAAVFKDIAEWVSHYKEKYEKEFTGYYCYVIPRKPGDINDIWKFTYKKKLYRKNNIREITYARLLDEATGEEDSLRKLYLCLPALLEKEFKKTTELKAEDMMMLFKKNIR